MTIVEKVVRLLNVNGHMTLEEIYNSLPEHTKASIRGNINRHISKGGGKIQRVDRGIYSVIEIISVTEMEEGLKSVNYTATYYSEDKEISFIHENYVTNENLETGVYQRMDNFASFEEMESHMKSLKGMLIKGDSREILKRLKSESFDLLVTDVPYKVISGGSGGKDAPTGMLAKNDGKIFKHNEIHFSEYLPELYRVLKDGTHAYFFVNFLNLEEMMKEIQKAGFKIHNLLVWEKNNAVTNRWYMKNAEYVLFCRKGKAKAINDCGCKTVHQVNNIIGNKIHETEKPLDLLRMYIRNSAKPGDMVLDPFAGSGSTLMAALLEGMKCTTIEIDETYIPRIKERINNYLRTGNDFRYV